MFFRILVFFWVQRTESPKGYSSYSYVCFYFYYYAAGEVSIVTDVSSYSINFTLSDTSQDYECLIMTVHGVLLTSSRITKENVGVFRSLQPNINYTIKCKGSENKCFFSSTSVRTRLGSKHCMVNIFAITV